MELAPYLCYQLDFLLDFFTEDKSYQYLQDASSLPCYLTRALSKLSPNIQNIGSSPFCTDFFRPEVTSPSANLHTSKGRRKAILYGELAIFPIFRPSYLSALIRYQAK